MCLWLAAFPHYCTDPDVTWGNGRGCHLVVQYWVNLQLVHGFCCCDNIAWTQYVSECLYSLYAWFLFVFDLFCFSWKQSRGSYVDCLNSGTVCQSCDDVDSRVLTVVEWSRRPRTWHDLCLLGYTQDEGLKPLVSSYLNLFLERLQSHIEHLYNNVHFCCVSSTNILGDDVACGISVWCGFAIGALVSLLW